jgi:hypothetical protein
LPACRAYGALFCLSQVLQPFFGIGLREIAECRCFAGNNIDHREAGEQRCEVARVAM